MSHDDDDFATLFAQTEMGSAKGRRGVKVGETVRGRVVSVGSSGAFVDMGEGKAEALLPLDEIRDAQGQFTVKVGDEVQARAVELNGKDGCVVLRRSMSRSGPVSSGELEKAAQFGLAVEGTVTTVNKGGVDVMVAGVRGFCPISQLELRHVEDAATYVGQKLQFRITKYETDNRGANMVLSRRALLEDERREAASATREKLKEGAVLPGTVSSLRDFGAFVDLGGIDGLLPASEISYQRGVKPSDVLSVGQQIEVQVLRIEKTDDAKRPERISLSLKALAQDPWMDVTARMGLGTKFKGVVTRVESFGAFVELAPGVEGLVHVSELAGGRQARHAREIVKPQDSIEVTVLSVDRETRRIALGTGQHEEIMDDEDRAAVKRASAPTSLGTFGDLFNKR